MSETQQLASDASSPSNASAEGGTNRVAVTGASGLVGCEVCRALEETGMKVVRLVRRTADPSKDEVYWNPASGDIDAAGLEGVQAVVHLAGENVGAGRWTPERKEAIAHSRIEGTRLLSEALAGLDKRPHTLISASAMGYYGDRGADWVDEDAAPGEGFLAGVAQKWEAATQPAAEAGIRVVCLRIGLVMSAEGGSLSRMLKPFKLGLGGRFGSGEQYVSWVSNLDLARAVLFLLERPDVSGPVNGVAPNPVTNAQYVATLGHVLKRPTLLPVPRAAVKLMFGEMGESLLLKGARINPKRLLDAGFTFTYENLESAIRGHLEIPAPTETASRSA
jgi:uncharacterized protein (TIGR01777 family)